MVNRYKIYIGRREDEFIKAINALVDSGLFIFSYMRCRNLEDVRKYYGSGESRHLRDLTEYTDWIVTGYHEECKRQIAGVDKDWGKIDCHEQITLDDFLKEIQKEKENVAGQLHTQV